MGVYLDPSQSGVEWLLDASSADAKRCAREAWGRRPADTCEPSLVADDLDLLAELLPARHFGIATGLVAPAAASQAVDAVVAARDRLAGTSRMSVGDALGGLSDRLRATLSDRHIALIGDQASAIRTREPRYRVAGEAPIATAVLGGVLCTRITRFYGTAAESEALWAWAASADEHFRHARIVLDLRGNSGGNDAIPLAWAAPAIGPDARLTGESTEWRVAGRPLGLFNSAALTEALDGPDAVPRYHREHRHEPAAGDVLELVREDWAKERVQGSSNAGGQGWPGRLMVLVDGGTGSSGESAAEYLRQLLGARLVGQPTRGSIEYGNVTPYLLPHANLCVHLPTRHNDFGRAVEMVGFQPDLWIDPRVPISEVAHRFDRLWAEGPIAFGSGRGFGGGV